METGPGRKCRERSRGRRCQRACRAVRHLRVKQSENSFYVRDVSRAQASESALPNSLALPQRVRFPLFQAFDLSRSIDLLALESILVYVKALTPQQAQKRDRTVQISQTILLCDFVPGVRLGSLRGERGCDGSHSRANSEGLPGCVDVEQGNTTGRFGQVWKSVPHFSDLNHSTGTTYSLLRTMFSRARAASSMVRGSVRSFCTSAFNEWFTLRNASTSVCIAVSC